MFACVFCFKFVQGLMLWNWEGLLTYKKRFEMFMTELSWGDAARWEDVNIQLLTAVARSWKEQVDTWWCQASLSRHLIVLFTRAYQTGKRLNTHTHTHTHTHTNKKQQQQNPHLWAATLIHFNSVTPTMRRHVDGLITGSADNQQEAKKPVSSN